MNGRRLSWLGVAGLAVPLGACQLLSGLSGYHESGSAGSSSAGSGGATSSTSAATGGMGGATSTTVSTTTSSTSTTTTTGTCGTTGNSTSSTTTGNSSASSSSSSSSGGCDGGATCPYPISPSYPGIAAVSAKGGAVAWATGTAPNMMISFLPMGATTPTSMPVDDVRGLAVASDGATVFFTGQTGCKPIGLYQITLMSQVTQISKEAGLIDVGAVVFQDATHVAWAGQHSDSQWHFYGTMPGASPAPAYADHATNTSSLPIAADGADFYWPYSPHFNELTNLTAIGLALYPTEPQYLAVDPTPTTGYLYWIGQETGNDPSSVKLSRIAKNAGNMASKDGVAHPVAIAGGLAVDDTYAYWLENSGDCSLPFGSLRRVSTATWQTLGFEEVAGDLVCPTNLVLDGKSLYYSAGDSGSVQVYRVSGQ